MDPHTFERDGNSFEVEFERTPEGWIGRISCEGSEKVQVIAFPNGPGFDAQDVRGSLIAGCEAAITRFSGPVPTRH